MAGAKLPKTKEELIVKIDARLDKLQNQVTRLTQLKTTLNASNDINEILDLLDRVELD